MNPKRVLFIAEGQLGDLLLMTPALRALKQTFPDATQSVLVLDRHSPTTPLPGTQRLPAPLLKDGSGTALATNPYVSNITVIDRKALRTLPMLERVLAELRIAKHIRSQKFDTVVCTFPEDRFALWAFISGAGVRVGQNDQAFRWLLTHTPDILKGDNGVLSYYCDLVCALGARSQSLDTEYRIPEEAELWANEHLRSLGIPAGSACIAFHPGATGNYKIWPPERYAALIDRLHEELGVQTMVFCGIADEEITAEVTRRTRAHPAIVRTQGDLPRFAALLKHCSLLISNDSGPRHLAVAIGLPTLALFRQFHDREWKVYADSPTCVTIKGHQPCTLCPDGICQDRIPEGENYGAHCIGMIGVDEVLKEVKSMIRSTRPIL